MILEPPWRQSRAEKEAKEDPRFLLDVLWSSSGTRELKGQNSGGIGFFVFKTYCFYLFISCINVLTVCMYVHLIHAWWPWRF